MVNIQEVRFSNAELKGHSHISTAVFVGATRGIGRSTLIQLAKNVPAPKVYIIGRSLSSTTPLLDELKSINPRGTFTFLQGQISLIKDVDTICAEIKSKEQSLDLLFLSAGQLSLAGRQETAEGLDTPFAVAYYERARFLYHLLPLLAKAPSPRVVSVLAAGQEGNINLEDLELRYHYSLPNEAVHTATMMGLSMYQLSKSYPSVSFVYIYPGFVDTELLKRMFGTTSGIWAVLGYLGQWVIYPVLRLFSTSFEEAGERGLFVATNGRYGVSKSEGNFYRLDPVGDPVKPNPTFDKLKEDGTDDIVWKHTLDVFDRITARD